MIQKYSFLIISVLLLLISSCVSKKKYLEMESGRLKAEELSRRLGEENITKDERIRKMIADFESMKNELLENNAIKDNHIDSLRGEIFSLIEDLNKQKESLQETSFNLDFEKQRLSNAIQTKDRTITGLESKIEQLEEEITVKNSAIDKKNFDISRLMDEAKLMNGKITAADKRANELSAEMEEVRKELVKLQSLIKEKDATITRLQNNVKLLKEELGN